MRIFIILTILSLSLSSNGFAQADKTKKSKVSKTTKAMGAESGVARSPDQNKRRTTGPAPDLKKALELAKAGKHEEAAMQLFQLSYSPKYREQRMQIRYILGLMLYQLKLNQVAAFQFISVIKEGNNRYVDQALEKLSLAADQLGDDALLNYAISRVKIDQFPANQRDMMYYRIGEFQLRNKQHAPAISSFERVRKSSPVYPKAKYLEGLAYAESKQPGEAVKTFDELMRVRGKAGVTDSSRVAALMGKARSLYQMEEWDAAIANYREVPRDTEFWHDTLFESSWAMLRSGKFRSALSNFHSLHSSYYEDYYLPESLLLRSIVYLYICKYDEMEKVLNLYNKIYRPVYNGLDRVIKNYRDPVQYFNEVVKVILAYKKQGDNLNKEKFEIPFLVVRRITKEGDFQNSYAYIKQLLDEKRRLQALPASWRSSSIGRYSRKIIDTRLLKARQRAGRQIRFHLENLREELVELFEQEGFIRYEMINGKKESLKKKIAGKDLEADQVNQSSSRDYYIQNGYEYYPFRGEYWLDELGNYHYIGTQSCE